MAGNMPTDVILARQAACRRGSPTRLFRSLSVCCLVLSSLCIFPVFAQEDRASLPVCLLADNPPYSSQQDENGFDLDTAKAVAKTIGLSFVPVWIQNDTVITEIDETDMPLYGLLRGECDVIFSVPGEEALKEVPELAVGDAYYGAGFELVGHIENGPKSLDTVGDKPIAVRAQTIANFMLSARKIETFTVFSLEDALSALTAGKAGGALLWGPKAGWYLHTHPNLQLTVVDVEPPGVVRWNESAATRQDDVQLREIIDSALNALGEAGTLTTLLEKYGMPVHRPFDTTYSFAEMQELMFHSLSNRQQ